MFDAAKFTAIAYSVLNSTLTNHIKNVRVYVHVKYGLGKHRDMGSLELISTGAVFRGNTVL